MIEELPPRPPPAPSVKLPICHVRKSPDGRTAPSWKTKSALGPENAALARLGLLAPAGLQQVLIFRKDPKTAMICAEFRDSSGESLFKRLQ